MRGAWTVASVLLTLVGFVAPIAWAGALVTGVLAIGSAPAGTRADGKARSGGLLGGAVDAAVVSAKMKDCAECKAKIPKDATRCQHCGVEQPAPETEDNASGADESPIKECPQCHTRILKTSDHCRECGAAQPR